MPERRIRSGATGTNDRKNDTSVQLCLPASGVLHFMIIKGLAGVLKNPQA
jgi:hypothetical protein